MAHQVADRGAETSCSERPAHDTLDAQKHSLEMLVGGSPLDEVLTYLARVVERQSGGRVVASILLLDGQGRLRNGAAPSLPEDYVRAIDGLKADTEVGTCSAAAALGSVVITPDIASDPKWSALKHLPLGLGLRAAWSLPIFARDGRVLGTFGTYFRERREPTAPEREVVEVLARTAALAIESKRAEAERRSAYDELGRRLEERTSQLARANATLKAEVAERMRAEETLRENEQRLKMALQTGNLGSWELDLVTLRLESSPTCKTNFGRQPDADFTYQNLYEAIHPEDRAGVRAAVARAVEGRADYHEEYRAVWPDGSTRWIIAHGRGVYAPDGAPLRMVGVTIDVTERRRAEEIRRELSHHRVAAQEEERRRISRELHDQMGQQLAALMIGLQTLGGDSYGRRKTLDTLRHLQGLTDQLSREVHTLAWELRPPALDDLGLHAALCNYVEEWAERSRIPVDFHSAGFEGGRLPFEHETALYRIAQEALTNIFRHSGADRVSFILERRGDRVLAVVEDNGAGFDVETLLRPSDEGRKLGLLGMRERAALLGGTINIESEPGAGTTIFVRIPVGGKDGSPHE